MKIQIMSDLHLDFYHPGILKFVSKLVFDSEAVLVIAGDFMESRTVNFGHMWTSFIGRYSKVITVLGNHEYYGSSKFGTIEVMKEVQKMWPSLKWLENKTCTVKIGKQKQRFIGCTLWFPEDPMATTYKTLMGDFLVIKDFEKWVYKANRKSLEFLRRTVRPDDVVITHHIPLVEGTDPRWRTKALTPFFVCREAEEIIRNNKPKLWIYGHTHDSHDFMVDQTRLVCNPYGYYPGGLNKNFNPGLIIDV